MELVNPDLDGTLLDRQSVIADCTSQVLPLFTEHFALDAP
jgi:hydroxymethylpyrimidine pyrophosphatase-like HAD family hydrolase